MRFVLFNVIFFTLNLKGSDISVAEIFRVFEGSSSGDSVGSLFIAFRCLFFTGASLSNDSSLFKAFRKKSEWCAGT